MDMWGLKVATAWCVSPEKRAELFIEFQGGDEFRVLTGTYKTMGEGATLTRARTCIMMDLDWSIAAEKPRAESIGPARVGCAQPTGLSPSTPSTRKSSSPKAEANN